MLLLINCYVTQSKDQPRDIAHMSLPEFVKNVFSSDSVSVEVYDSVGLGRYIVLNNMLL
jgi:hypothetical protein